MSKEKIGNRNAEDENQSERIGWDHPLCKTGIVPGYLLNELFGYSDQSWKKLTAKLTCCKNLHGEPWFSLRAFEEYLASPHAENDR